MNSSLSSSEQIDPTVDKDAAQLSYTTALNPVTDLNLENKNSIHSSVESETSSLDPARSKRRKTLENLCRDLMNGSKGAAISPSENLSLIGGAVDKQQVIRKFSASTLEWNPARRLSASQQRKFGLEPSPLFKPGPMRAGVQLLSSPNRRTRTSLSGLKRANSFSAAEGEVEEERAKKVSRPGAHRSLSFSQPATSFVLNLNNSTSENPIDNIDPVTTESRATPSRMIHSPKLGSESEGETSETMPPALQFNEALASENIFSDQDILEAVASAEGQSNIAENSNNNNNTEPTISSNQKDLLRDLGLDYPVDSYENAAMLTEEEERLFADLPLPEIPPITNDSNQESVAHQKGGPNNKANSTETEKPNENLLNDKVLPVVQTTDENVDEATTTETAIQNEEPLATLSNSFNDNSSALDGSLIAAFEEPSASAMNSGHGESEIDVTLGLLQGSTSDGNNQVATGNGASINQVNNEASTSNAQECNDQVTAEASTSNFQVTTLNEASTSNNQVTGEASTLENPVLAPAETSVAAPDAIQPSPVVTTQPSTASVSTAVQPSPVAPQPAATLANPLALVPASYIRPVSSYPPSITHEVWISIHSKFPQFAHRFIDQKNNFNIGSIYVAQLDSVISHLCYTFGYPLNSFRCRFKQQKAVFLKDLLYAFPRFLHYKNPPPVLRTHITAFLTRNAPTISFGSFRFFEVKHNYFIPINSSMVYYFFRIDQATNTLVKIDDSMGLIIDFESRKSVIKCVRSKHFKNSVYILPAAGYSHSGDIPPRFKCSNASYQDTVFFVATAETVTLVVHTQNWKDGGTLQVYTGGTSSGSLVSPVVASGSNYNPFVFPRTLNTTTAVVPPRTPLVANPTQHRSVHHHHAHNSHKKSPVKGVVIGQPLFPPPASFPERWYHKAIISPMNTWLRKKPLPDVGVMFSVPRSVDWYKATLEEFYDLQNCKVVKAWNLSVSAMGDDVIPDATQVSLSCPLSMVRIKLPGKFIGCTHIQCFDLLVYEMMYKNSYGWYNDRSAKTFQCPICYKYFCVDELELNLPFLILLDRFPKLETDEKVLVEPDGSFKLHKPKSPMQDNNNSNGNFDIKKDPALSVDGDDVDSFVKAPSKRDSNCEYIDLDEFEEEQQSAAVVLKSTAEATPPFVMYDDDDDDIIIID